MNEIEHLRDGCKASVVPTKADVARDELDLRACPLHLGLLPDLLAGLII